MRQAGYTLVEILVVVVILGIVSAALLGSNTDADVEQTLDAAAAEVAASFRFARSEAIRTGQPHGVYASSVAQSVKVYRLAAGVPVYSVRHPVDKKLYSLDFQADPMLGPVSIGSVAFWFAGSALPTNYLGFGPSGVPKHTDGFGTRMLASASVTLTAAGQTRIVSVAPMTGRATIQ